MTAYLDEGGHAVLRPQRGLDPPQEVVGLEDQDHLSVDVGEDVGDLLEVDDDIRLDLRALPLGLWCDVQPLLNGAPGPED